MGVLMTTCGNVTSPVPAYSRRPRSVGKSACRDKVERAASNPAPADRRTLGQLSRGSNARKGRSECAVRSPVHTCCRGQSASQEALFFRDRVECTGQSSVPVPHNRRPSSLGAQHKRAECVVHAPIFSDDPFRLRRFVEAQRLTHEGALTELAKGRKESCWMWFELPAPPHIVNGIEKGSAKNCKYSLRSDDEVRAYL